MAERAMLSIAVCDDEPLFAAQAARCCDTILAARTVEYTVDTYTSACALLEAGRRYDVVFLDISMPGMDGFAAAEHIKEKHVATKVVFLTSHEEHVHRAFRYNVFRYLQKPCDAAEIEEALAAAMAELAQSKLAVQASSGAVHYVALEDIVYLESLGDGAAVYLEGKAIIQAMSLKQWVERYGAWFVRTHKSYVVNLAHVATLGPRHALLTGGYEVPVSVRSRAVVKQRLRDYIRAHARFG